MAEKVYVTKGAFDNFFNAITSVKRKIWMYVMVLINLVNDKSQSEII